MFLDEPPSVIDARVFAVLPERFRRTGGHSAWADANKPGEDVDSFLEGPVFDPEGNLYVVDIPYGRIFRIDPDGGWELVLEYDGEPNGLARRPDGTLLVADYRNGILRFDPASGDIVPVLSRRDSESFKGVNDVIVASNGDVYFTDQGQSGLHDPSGRVYRLTADGRLHCLMDNLPSPNGLVLNPAETVLFVAMTRDNSVWRAPLTSAGVTKVGRFCTLFGASGPDGLAMDERGRLVLAHASLGHVFVFAADGQCVARVRSPVGPTCTNVTYRDQEKRTIVFTESSSGTVLEARLHDVMNGESNGVVAR
jgi:gluconolactonase